MKDDSEKQLALFKEVFAHSKEAIAIVDKEGRFVVQNQANIDMFGFSDVDFIQLSLSDLMDDKTVKRIIKELKANSAFRGEVMSSTKDGTELILDAFFFQIKDAKGKTKYTVGYKSDITSRHLAETALRIGEDRFQQMFEGIPDPAYIFEKDKQGSIKLILVNRTIREITNDRIKENIGKNVEAVFPQTHSLANLVKNVMRTGKGAKEEIIFQDDRMSEEKLVICTVSRPAKNLVFLVTEDFTETRKLFDALQHSELEKLSVLNAMSEHVIYYTGTDMKIAWANRAAAESIGKQTTEMIGHKCFSLWHGRDEPCEGCPVIRASKSGKSEKQEIATPDGRVWYIRGHPMYDDLGKLVGLIEVTREITSQKRAEQLLKDAEEQYRSILESMADPIHVIDKSMKIIFANPAITKWMEELSLESEIAEKELGDAFPFLSKETFEEYKQVFKTGKIHSKVEQIKLHKDLIYTAVRKIPIHRAGKVDQIITVIRDITGQQNAQIALQESEASYRLLYENLPDGLFITDISGEITTAGDKTNELFGYAPEEIVGRAFIEFIHPDDAKWMIKAFREGLDAGGKTLPGLDVRGIRKDGTELFIHISSAVIYRDEQAVGFQSLVSDVTERTRAAKIVMQEREKYRILFDAAPIAIGVSATSGKIIDINTHMHAMLGYTREEMMSLSAEAIYVEKGDREAWLQILDEKGSVLNFETQFENKGKEIIEILMNVDIVDFGEDGKVQLSTFRDVTELKRTRRDLTEASARANFFNDLMAHDLNNIHQGVLMSLELILMGPEVSPDTRDKAEAALEQVKKSIGLIASVRKLSNIELRDVELESIDLYHVISEAMKLAKHSFPSKETEMKMGFGKGERMVLADQFLIDMFYNLLHNAIKVSKTPVEIEIVSRVSSREGFVEIEIIDKGPGISDDRKRTLFTRLDKGKTLGSGIGLTLVRRITERYDGAVWIENRVPNSFERGAKFVVQLRLDQ
ncbi:MAG: PAS domain-containing sensor histidine kinase [Candidatus Thorarchaeota archaeon]